MSIKTTCPACDVHLSSITMWLYDPNFSDGAGSPCCGISVESFLEIDAFRKTRVPKHAVDRIAEILRERDKLRADYQRVCGVLRKLKYAIEDAEIP